MKHVIVATLFVFSIGFARVSIAEDTPEASEVPSGFYGKKDALLGDVSFGPGLTLVGFPAVFQFSLESKYQDAFGASFDYGIFPTLTFNNVSLGYNSWSLTAKWYPFHRALYLGVGFGSQSFHGSQVKNVVVGGSITQPLTVTVTVSTTYLNPHLGWRWISNSGFFYGMQLGVQVPLSNSAAITSDDATLNATSEFQQASADLDEQAKTFAKSALPIFTLVQMGWMF